MAERAEMLSPADFLADIEVAVTRRMPDPRWGDRPEDREEHALEFEQLQETVKAADGSKRRLKVAFASLVDRLGRGRASHFWWSVFGAEDAAETG